MQNMSAKSFYLQSFRMSTHFYFCDCGYNFDSMYCVRQKAFLRTSLLSDFSRRITSGRGAIKHSAKVFQPRDLVSFGQAGADVVSQSEFSVVPIMHRKT